MTVSLITTIQDQSCISWNSAETSKQLSLINAKKQTKAFLVKYEPTESLLWYKVKVMK